MQKVLGSSVVTTASAPSSSSSSSSAAVASNSSSSIGKSGAKIKLVNGKSLINEPTSSASSIMTSLPFPVASPANTTHHQFDINSLMMAAAMASISSKNSASPVAKIIAKQLKNSDKENDEEETADVGEQSTLTDATANALDEDESDSNYLNKLRRHNRPLTNLNTTTTTASSSSSNDKDNANEPEFHHHHNHNLHEDQLSAGDLLNGKSSGAKKRKRIFITGSSGPSGATLANNENEFHQHLSACLPGKYLNDEADGEDVNDQNGMLIKQSYAALSKHMKMSESSSVEEGTRVGVKQVKKITLKTK